MSDLETVPSPEVERRLRRELGRLPAEPTPAALAAITVRSAAVADRSRGRAADSRLPFALALGVALVAAAAGLAAITRAAGGGDPPDLATEQAASAADGVLPTGPSWWWHLAAVALTLLVVGAVHRRFRNHYISAGLAMVAGAVIGAAAIATIHMRVGANMAATAPSFGGFEVTAVDREWLPAWDFGRFIRMEYRPDGTVESPDRSDGLVRDGFARAGFSTMGGGPASLIEPGQPCWNRGRSGGFDGEFWCLVEDGPDRLVIDATVIDTDGLLLIWPILLVVGLPGAVLTAIGIGRLLGRRPREQDGEPV